MEYFFWVTLRNMEYIAQENSMLNLPSSNIHDSLNSFKHGFCLFKATFILKLFRPFKINC